MKTPFSTSIMLAVLTTAMYGQNINNTLGSTGVFTVKDGSTTFLSLNQADGYLSLTNSLTLAATSGSTIGVIYKGTDRFIHNYGSTNTFVGKNAGNFTMGGTVAEGISNTGLGEQVLMSLTTGSNNSAVGYAALASNTTGHWNTAVGASALAFNTDGAANSAFGHYALRVNTSGQSNSAFGKNALMANTTGPYNSAFGYASLASNVTGRDNSAMGYSALFSSVGDSNTAYGYYAGSNITSGSNNTLIGHSAQPNSGTASNQITLGNNAITALRCNVTTITSLSDARDKKNIRDLPLGLDFLMSVQPRLFNWDRREWYGTDKADGSKMQESPTAGFIAQELDETQTKADAEWLNLVLKSNPDRLEATPGNLLPIMVKAIQELKHENNSLKAELEALKRVVHALDSKLAVQ